MKGLGGGSVNPNPLLGVLPDYRQFGSPDRRCFAIAPDLASLGESPYSPRDTSAGVMYNNDDVAEQPTIIGMNPPVDAGSTGLDQPLPGPRTAASATAARLGGAHDRTSLAP